MLPQPLKGVRIAALVLLSIRFVLDIVAIVVWPTMFDWHGPQETILLKVLLIVAIALNSTGLYGAYKNKPTFLLTFGLISIALVIIDLVMYFSIRLLILGLITSIIPAICSVQAHLILRAGQLRNSQAGKSAPQLAGRGHLY